MKTHTVQFSSYGSSISRHEVKQRGHSQSHFFNFIARGVEIFCGYDADPVGDAMARAMINRYPSIKRLRPLRKD